MSWFDSTCFIQHRAEHYRMGSIVRVMHLFSLIARSHGNDMNTTWTIILEISFQTTIKVSETW
jgi:hypothetical protein